MQVANLTKLEMAKKMATSRSQLDRVLDPENVSVQLDTLIKAGARRRKRSGNQDQATAQKSSLASGNDRICDQLRLTVTNVRLDEIGMAIGKRCKSLIYNRT